ncbi:hypothetical protein [Uliginosibacterium sp. H1]|uniref:hypothetical protein n=1 Tax=Uliginosibacterium sp. H1 TaxID=3114757 RepID=UPI002E18158E|nr:hypothetical protein [Uliginosibacterium sp. H1]
MSDPLPPLLSEEIVAFMKRGVSIVAASRDDCLQASMARVGGCHVAPDRRSVTLVLSARQSVALLADVTACGQIAVAITEPSTHRTVQLKGSDAVVEPLRPFDHASAEAHIEAFVAEVGPMGYGEALTRAVVHPRPDDRVAISFTPLQAFSQTPGAKAGEAIR